MQVLKNPYYIFSVVWLASVSFYLLGWSNFFPSISTGLLVFLLAAIFLHAVFGAVLNKLGFLDNLHWSKSNNLVFYMLSNIVIWIMQFAYSGIPLLYILRGMEYDYQEFGIPTVKVVAITLNGFLSVYSLGLFLSSKNKKYLLCSLFCLSLFILSYSRGLVLSNGISMFFLAVLYNRKNARIKMSRMLLVIAGALTVLYLFGVAGNVRVINQVATANNVAYEDVEYSSNAILEIGEASTSFQENIVPDEFFWTYIYFCSPIANLQYNITKNNSRPPTVVNTMDFVLNEIVFDFISKRINTIMGKERLRPLLIVDALTVCTTFAGSFCYVGWLGMILLLFFMLLFPIIFLATVGKKNKYYPVALAVLCSVYFFSFFDNMFSYAGMSPQLLYPFIFSLTDKVLPALVPQKQ